MKKIHAAPVSVVIPCFCCAATIGRAVASVAQQAVRPAEVILVDDASGDGTLAVLQELARQHGGWIKVLSLEKNLGAASARNAGWSMAMQPYIAFLDADDSWHPDKLCIQFEYMQKHSEVVLCGHQCIWLRDGDSLPVPAKEPRATAIRAGSLLCKNAFSTPTVLLQRDIPFRFKEGRRYAEDLLLWQEIAFAGLQVMRLESPLAYVHKPIYGAGGLSSRLWEMEKGELGNFTLLYRAGYIGYFRYAAAAFLSAIKFLKRLLLAKMQG